MKKIMLPLLIALTIILTATVSAAELRSFEESIKLFKPHHANKIHIHPEWKFAQKIFDHCLKSEKPKQQIPKIFHFIWVGENPLTKEMQKYIESWRKYHPDWELKLWRDKDIEKFGLKNKKLYEKSTNPGKKSDIARYEILYKFGGVYLDTDFECFAPITHIWEHANFFAALDDAAQAIYCFNGLIGTLPHHPIIKTCIELLSNVQSDIENTPEILRQTGPHLLTQAIKKHWQTVEHIMLLPFCYCMTLPRSAAIVTRERKLQHLTPCSFAMHHWHGSWLTSR